MKVVNIDPRYQDFEEIALPLPNGREIVAKKGTVLDVPDELGESLIKQTDAWKKASAKADVHAGGEA